jgi:hypothetical protein
MRFYNCIDSSFLLSVALPSFFVWHSEKRWIEIAFNHFHVSCFILEMVNMFMRVINQIFNLAQYIHFIASNLSWLVNILREVAT